MEILTNEYRQLAIPEGFEGVELDMGCGRGGFTKELAARYPERLILASDVMIGRLRIVEAKFRKGRLTNTWALRAESGMLVEFQLPPSSLDRIHLLCPDPWPKDLPKRGRRLGSTAFMNLLPRVLKPGGVFHFASDEMPYVDDVRRILDSLPFFQWAPEALDDISDIKTDFEKQWEAEGKQVCHLAVRYKPIAH